MLTFLCTCREFSVPNRDKLVLLDFESISMLLKNCKHWSKESFAISRLPYCSKTTHFGFKTVPAEQKEELVAEVCNTVTSCELNLQFRSSTLLHRATIQ
jgi:hypothetical protein